MDVRKLPPSAQEAFRILAVKTYLKGGKKQEEVAKTFGVTRSRISYWECEEFFAEYPKTAGNSTKKFSGSEGKVCSLKVDYFMLGLIRRYIHFEPANFGKYNIGQKILSGV